MFIIFFNIEMVRIEDTYVMYFDPMIEMAQHNAEGNKHIHVVVGWRELLSWIFNSKNSNRRETHKRSFLKNHDSLAITRRAFREDDHWREFSAALNVTYSCLYHLNNSILRGSIFSIDENCLSNSSDPANDWPACDFFHSQETRVMSAEHKVEYVEEANVIADSNRDCCWRFSIQKLLRIGWIIVSNLVILSFNTVDTKEIEHESWK
mmetsp:Transcript_29790/g.34415  ORF Transcript_29790/g.34415 Transcript_29790/m.34415 type:complete len:207 (-) Transcript_29790:367-987(-)